MYLFYIYLNRFIINIYIMLGITEGSKNKEINPINNENKVELKKEEAKYPEEEFGIYDVDEKLDEELKLNSPIETLKKELCDDEEKSNENIEGEKKDLPVYDRKGNIIDKKDVTNYVLTNNLEMLKKLVFPLYNYATFKHNFGKFKYVNWKKLHIKCDYCRKTMFLKYYSMPEHFFKFHFEKMIENRLVSEIKQKYIIENLFIEKYKKLKKIENDLIVLELYYRNLKKRSNRKSTLMAKDYMKRFSKIKRVSLDRSIDLLKKRINGMIAQRNTTKNLDNNEINEKQIMKEI